jgi:hypothetical protein
VIGLLARLDDLCAANNSGRATARSTESGMHVLTMSPALRPPAVAACGVAPPAWPAPRGSALCRRRRLVACMAGRCSVRLGRRAGLGRVPGRPAVSAAAAGRRGQHPPHAREHAPAGTARRAGPVGRGTPGRPPRAAPRGRRLDGADDVHGTRTRHDDAPSPVIPAPLPAVPRAPAPPARHEPAARDGTEEDLPPADAERTAPALIQQRVGGAGRGSARPGSAFPLPGP